MHDPLDCVKRAPVLEEAGFDDLWEADHFLPFHHTNAHCANCAVTLEAYLSATKRVTCGSMVTCPTIRFHPAEVALTYATLALYHPGRVALALGAGEAINEKACTGIWPSPKERVERLEEAVRLIKKCWTATDYFTFKGKYYNTFFFLHDKPKTSIPLYIAAGGPKTARIAGKYGEGIITGFEDITNKVIINNFERSAREVGKDPSKIKKIAYILVSYHPDIEKALKIPRRSITAMVPGWLDIMDPRIIESNASIINDEAIINTNLIAITTEELIKGIEKTINSGANYVILEDNSPEPYLSLKVFKNNLLPYFQDK